MALHRLFERPSERAIAAQEPLARVGEPHAALGPAAGHPLDELEAGGLLQLTKVTPGVAVRHLERLGRLLERAALLDGLQQPCPALAEFQVLAERDPNPQFGLHDGYRGAPRLRRGGPSVWGFGGHVGAPMFISSGAPGSFAAFPGSAAGRRASRAGSC